MTKTEFDDIILRLVKAGIEITLRCEDTRIIYDLNTGMKSHLHIYWCDQDQAIKCRGRYYHLSTVDTWDSLLREVKYCMHGRDFANLNWISLLLAEGVMKEVKTVTVQYL